MGTYEVVILNESQTHPVIIQNHHKVLCKHNALAMRLNNIVMKTFSIDNSQYVTWKQVWRWIRKSSDRKSCKYTATDKKEWQLCSENTTIHSFI